MTRRAWVAAGLGLLIASVAACTSLGPSIECDEYDAATCEQVWRAAAAQQADVYQLPPDVRPIRVRIDATPMAGGAICPSYVYITWSNGRETSTESFC